MTNFEQIKSAIESEDGKYKLASILDAVLAECAPGMVKECEYCPSCVCCWMNWLEKSEEKELRGQNESV